MAAQISAKFTLAAARAAFEKLQIDDNDLADASKALDKFAVKSADIAGDLFQSYWEELEFAGFDAKVIANQFCTLAVASNFTRKTGIIDMWICSSIAAVRGTKIDKILEKSSDSLKDVLGALKVIYKIVSTGTKHQTGTDERTKITLGRAMACAPNVPCEIVHRMGQKTVPYHLLDGLHPCMMTTVFSAMIPKGEEFRGLRKTLKDKHLEYLLEFDKVITKGKGSSESTIKSIQDAAINGTVYSDSTRLKLLHKWGVIDKDCNYLPFPKGQDDMATYMEKRQQQAIAAGAQKRAGQGNVPDE